MNEPLADESTAEPERISPKWSAAFAAIEVAQAADRLWRAASEVRVARLKQAAELERQGRMEEAVGLIDQVRAEQERA